MKCYTGQTETSRTWQQMQSRTENGGMTEFLNERRAVRVDRMTTASRATARVAPTMHDCTSRLAETRDVYPGRHRHHFPPHKQMCQAYAAKPCAMCLYGYL